MMFTRQLFRLMLPFGSAGIVFLPGDWPTITCPRQNRTIEVPTQNRTITTPRQARDIADPKMGDTP